MVKLETLDKKELYNLACKLAYEKYNFVVDNVHDNQVYLLENLYQPHLIPRGVFHVEKSFENLLEFCKWLTIKTKTKLKEVV